MQYLLTESEYLKLTLPRTPQTDKATRELQELCTKAAMHIPMVPPWARGDTPSPWGCILGPDEQNPMYCDECPALAVCPHLDKSFSK